MLHVLFIAVNVKVETKELSMWNWRWINTHSMFRISSGRIFPMTMTLTALNMQPWFRQEIILPEITSETGLSINLISPPIKSETLTWRPSASFRMDSVSKISSRASSRLILLSYRTADRVTRRRSEVMARALRIDQLPSSLCPMTGAMRTSLIFSPVIIINLSQKNLSIFFKKSWISLLVSYLRMR